MAHSDETPHVSLPIFAADDTPTWLGDWNPAMESIDRAFADLRADYADMAVWRNAESVEHANIIKRLDAIEEDIASMKIRLAKDEQQIYQNAVAIENIQVQLG